MKRIRSISEKAEGETAAIAHAAAAWKARADAGLSGTEMATLEAWCESDPRHREALARFNAVWEKFDRPFHAGASQRLRDELAARARRRRRRTIAAATGLAVLAIVGTVWRSAGEREAAAQGREVAGAPASGAVLLMPVRQSLPDGSVVDLRAGAEIAVDFSPDLRRVALRRGEAHFQVTKDPARPFVVVAGGVEARAVGTAFSVQIQPTGVEVLVTEGQVAVDQPTAVSPGAASAPTPGAPEPLAVLGVGHRIVVQPARVSTPLPQVTAIRPEELAERLAWRTPRVEFTRTPLAEAIAIHNGHAASRRSADRPSVRFVIDDPALAAIRVSGLFRVDRTEAFVGLLRNGFGIEADVRGPEEIVLRPASAAQRP
jgi:transmembrane sensor